MSRPARRVCCAVKAHRSCDAVRGCALLAADRPGSDAHFPVTLFKHSPWSRTLLVHTVFAHRLRPFRSPSVEITGQFFTRLAYLLHNQATALCYRWSNDCAHQSSTLRDVPFRLYGSLRAVKVVRPCRPDASTVTALAPPSRPCFYGFTLEQSLPKGF